MKWVTTEPKGLWFSSGFVAVVKKFVLSVNNRGEIALPSMLSNPKEVLNHCACTKRFLVICSLAFLSTLRWDFGRQQGRCKVWSVLVSKCSLNF
jgi:hypothetical protein